MRRRDAARLLSVGSSVCAAAGPTLLEGAPLRLASLLDAVAIGEADSLQQRQRQLSHYSASTSSAAHHRSFSSAASGSSPPDRGFASQPAYDYDTFDDTSSGQGLAQGGQQQRHDLLSRAHLAAAALKAKAIARMEQVNRLEQMGTVGVPTGPKKFREVVPAETRPRQQLTRIKEAEDLAPQLPIWERLSNVFSERGAMHSECSRAVHEYRMEVLHGHDPDAADALDEHVPFLRSAVCAAQQGYGPQTDLSRLSLRSRLPTPEEMQVSTRMSSCLEGLRVLMESSRHFEEGVVEGADGGDSGTAHHSMPPLLSSLAMQQLAQSQPPHDPAAALRSMRRQLEEALGPDVHAPLAAATAGDPAAAQGLEQAAQREQQEVEEVEASPVASKASRAARLRAEILLASRPWRLPRPTATIDDVLLMLRGLPGVDATSLENHVASLYRPAKAGRRRDSSFPAEPLSLPEEPWACLQRMEGAAAALVQELGAELFCELVKAAPWVLLLDPERQGRPQLSCLHLLDLDRQQAAALVKAHPALLTADVEAALLPAFEYLQGLGMTNQQIAGMLHACPTLCQPSSLQGLKTVAAFWLGRGMTKPDLINMLTSMNKPFGCNLTSWQLTYDWLAETVDFNLRDMSVTPWLANRSLIHVVGPRVALALEKGFHVSTPSQQPSKSPRSWQQPGSADKPAVSITQLVRYGHQLAASRLGVTPQDLEAFGEQWRQGPLLTWLESRQGSIERYRALTGPRSTATSSAVQQEQGREQGKQQSERQQRLQQQQQQERQDHDAQFDGNTWRAEQEEGQLQVQHA